LVKDGSCSWEVDEIPFDVHFFKDEGGLFSTKEMTLKVKEVRKKCDCLISGLICVGCEEGLETNWYRKNRTQQMGFQS